MKPDLGDLSAFLAVARAGGFRGAAKTLGVSPSGVSEAVRRLEESLGLRLFNRTTRSVVPTEAGRRLMERLQPALGEVEAALDAVNSLRDRPAGPLRLNVPFSAARLVLPSIVAPFLAAYRQAMDIDRPALQALYAETVIGTRLDGIVFPTTKLAALRIGQDAVDLGEGEVPAFDLMIENSGPGSLSGAPGITVPCGVDSADVPLGLSIDGLFHTDRRLLAIGAMLERLLPNPWRREQ